MQDACIPGNYTNHSLRRTAATRLLQAKVEEKIVKEITRHKSDCVQMYQRTSDNLKRDACLSLYGLNPRRIVTCEVTKPDRSTNSSPDVRPKVIENSETIVTVTM